MVEVKTFNELREKLEREVEKTDKSSFVVEIFLNKPEFIYQRGGGDKLFQVQYTMNATGDVVLGDSIEVERNTTFPKVGR